MELVGSLFEHRVRSPETLASVMLASVSGFALGACNLHGIRLSSLQPEFAWMEVAWRGRIGILKPTCYMTIYMVRNVAWI
ncbi:hypothetical protein CHELA1G11_12508 [Hyphomicrobiales bacterium]|nr:hypothetical protein CHELA1G2_11797 [Hyphomicrobiales bacterium]CAH1665298.1 hypothetical protein CHELA1G11_12508 [Hyphomicrobiales bacterium]